MLGKNRMNRGFGLAIAILLVEICLKIILSPDGVWKLKQVLLPMWFVASAASKRALNLLGVLAFVFALTSVARADSTADPTGFCPSPGSVPACTTGTGIGGETISVGSTSFVMEKNGSGTSASPWYLLVAIPDYSGLAPSLTISGFTQSGSATSNTFLPTNAGSIYDLFGIVGDSSMNASNMFGANEVAAFGSTPSFFDVFEYTFTGAFGSWTPYTINIGGTGLSAGTFLAASGGSNPFSTPFTVTGLVGGPTVPTPESSTLTILGAGLLGLAALAGRRSLSA